MLNLFKIRIPKDNSQEVTELQSWTVIWEVKTGWSNDTKKSSKVFIKESDSIEFRKQLEESAKFIGAWISTSRSQN